MNLELVFGSTRYKVDKDKNCENLSHLEITEVVLIHCNIVNTDYQQDSRILYEFVPDKPFGQLLDILPKNVIFLNTLTQNFHILTYGLLIKILNL